MILLFFQVRSEFSVDILSETHSLSYFETKIIFNPLGVIIFYA